MQHQHIARLAAPGLPGSPGNSVLCSFVLYLGLINVKLLYHFHFLILRVLPGSPSNSALLFCPFWAIFCLINVLFRYHFHFFNFWSYQFHFLILRILLGSPNNAVLIQRPFFYFMAVFWQSFTQKIRFNFHFSFLRVLFAFSLSL